MSAPGGADNPPGSPGGWWAAAERAAIKGTEVEGDSLVGNLARQLSARVILPEWRSNLKEALCPA